MTKKKLKQIKAKMLLKRWEEYDITQEDLMHIIDEGVLTAHDTSLDMHLSILWQSMKDTDSYLNFVLFDLSEIEASEEEILRALRPQKFRSMPKKIKEPDEEAVDDGKIEEIKEVQTIESIYAKFDQAVLELTEKNPDMPKTDIVTELKHLYQTNVADDTIRRRVGKIQKEHGLFRIEKPGAKKRT